MLITKETENLPNSANFHLVTRENCTSPAQSMTMILCGAQPKQMKTTSPSRTIGETVPHLSILIASNLIRKLQGVGQQ